MKIDKQQIETDNLYEFAFSKMRGAYDEATFVSRLANLSTEEREGTVLEALLTIATEVCAEEYEMAREEFIEAMGAYFDEVKKNDSGAQVMDIAHRIMAEAVKPPPPQASPPAAPIDPA